MKPCTEFVRVARNVRGGKGFEARYQAEKKAKDEHAAKFCGAVNDTLRWGGGSMVNELHSRPECELFYAKCRMPVAFGAPLRFISDAVSEVAVNLCE